MGSDWSGIILALLIGLGVAWVYNKGRKKFGSSANGKTLITAAVVVAVVLFLLFGASHTPHS
ncbi:MAG: hypothetical protein J2P26_02475 [Nocardiopsaceae bacterium]|nr:hypothetical protein [Nocardiopsaceae bacterium]